MIRRIGVVFVWAVATFVATAVALAAVRSVAGQVVDEPGSPLLAATSTLGPGDTTTTTVSPSTTSAAAAATVVPDDGLVVVPSGSGSGDDAATTTGAPVTTTTISPPAAPTTSTTTTTTTTPATTTTPPPATETTTYQLVGGWVRITHGSGTVALSGAGPNAGFTMEVESSGPDEVEVEFRADDHHSKFDAEWSGGELKVDMSEHDEDGDED